MCFAQQNVYVIYIFSLLVLAGDCWYYAFSKLVVGDADIFCCLFRNRIGFRIPGVFENFAEEKIVLLGWSYSLRRGSKSEGCAGINHPPSNSFVVAESASCVDASALLISFFGSACRYLCHDDLWLACDFQEATATCQKEQVRVHPQGDARRE